MFKKAGRAADNLSKSRRSLGNQDLAWHLTGVALTGSLRAGTGWGGEIGVLDYFHVRNRDLLESGHLYGFLYNGPGPGRTHQLR
ncbi:Hypp1506 [Branchiostoma lanceolatum]|uniref:Hypp1506 protein n=1 Tax=Branchiostoma lanceolatum TaxID=7740 RepID=A0A8J9ZKI4_BRALA|nr:Hypp1506 [Branchiostoma lanceolatum]